MLILIDYYLVLKYFRKITNLDCFSLNFMESLLPLTMNEKYPTLRELAGSVYISIMEQKYTNPISILKIMLKSYTHCPVKFSKLLNQI